MATRRCSNATVNVTVAWPSDQRLRSNQIDGEEPRAAQVDTPRACGRTGAVCDHGCAGAGVPQSPDHGDGRARRRRHHRRHHAALFRGGGAQPRPARRRREPDRRGRRRRRGGGAERGAGRAYAAGVLRLAACDGAGRQHRDLRAGEGLRAGHLPVQQRRGADRAGRQPGEDPGGAARVGPQEAGRADLRHAGARLAVAPARRQDHAARPRFRPRRCTTAAARR